VGAVVTTVVGPVRAVILGSFLVLSLSAQLPSDAVRSAPSSQQLPACFTVGHSAATFGCLVTTFAGIGQPSAGDGGPAVGAVLRSPERILAAPDGSVYIADKDNNRIRRVTRDGIIHTIAGTGSAESQGLGDGLPAVQAQLRLPRSMAFGADSSLLIADSNHYRIRRAGTDGTISTIAGNYNTFFSGEGVPASQASFGFPIDLAVDAPGNIYIADSWRIWRIGLDGIIRTIAGTGQSGSIGDGGPANQAQILAPRSLAVDRGRNLLYFVEAEGVPAPVINVRRIDLNS
jgi:hypothetical protein